MPAVLFRVQIWRPVQGIDFRTMYSSLGYVSRGILRFVNREIYLSGRFLFLQKLLQSTFFKK